MMTTIKVNEHQDVICEVGNVYLHSKREGIYFCINNDNDFVNLVDGNTYSFTFSDKKNLTLKGKILSIETNF